MYQFKDHLGNIRLSYSDTDGDGEISASSEILEENNYYPFGLKHKGYNNVPLTNHPYKYNGVELNESLELDFYEMPFRQYDAALGRFTSIDPVTHFANSTYNGLDNNPILIADPSGADGNMPRNSQEFWEGYHQNNPFPNITPLFHAAGVSGNTGGGTDPEIATEHLPEVVVTVSGGGGGIKSYGLQTGWGMSMKDWQEKTGYGGDPKAAREQYYKDWGYTWKGLDYSNLWSIDATGFKANWNLGMQAPGGTGMAEFWDGTFGGAMGISMIAPVASVAAPSSFGGLGSKINSFTARFVLNNSSWLNNGNWWRLGQGWNPTIGAQNIRLAWGAHSRYLSQVPRKLQAFNRWLRSYKGGHSHFPKWKP